MDYTAFININILPEKARKELEAFYEYLVFKYKRMDANSKLKRHGRFEEFLSTSIKLDEFVMPGRDERNER